MVCWRAQAFKAHHFLAADARDVLKAADIGRGRPSAVSRVDIMPWLGFSPSVDQGSSVSDADGSTGHHTQSRMRPDNRAEVAPADLRPQVDELAQLGPARLAFTMYGLHVTVAAPVCAEQEPVVWNLHRRAYWG